MNPLVGRIRPEKRAAHLTSWEYIPNTASFPSFTFLPWNYFIQFLKAENRNSNMHTFATSHYVFKIFSLPFLSSPSSKFHAWKFYTCEDSYSRRDLGHAGVKKGSLRILRLKLDFFFLTQIYSKFPPWGETRLSELNEGY